MDLMGRKLYRARDGAWIAGVCQGVADWLGAPVQLVRLLWALAMLPGGVPGIAAYLICWIFIPRKPGYGDF